MEADKLNTLLGNYYSGDISPDGYLSLLSALKESDELTPELEAERKMLLAIESYEPIEPKGFEERLIMAIDHRSKRKRNFFRIVYSCSAAAAMLIFVAIGLSLHDKNAIGRPQPIAMVSVADEAEMTKETHETEPSITANQDASVAHKNSPSYSISSEDLEKSARVVDEAIMEILANIQMAKNEAIEAIDNIEISQTTDYNIL